MGTDQIRVTVDGRVMDAELHEPALAVVRRLGVEIPTLCHHEALPPAGACRLCLVEVEKQGRRKVVTACNYPVEDGVSIQTSTDVVLQHRRVVVEMLLARCPDVPILKELAASFSLDRARFPQDDDTCILCRLCTSACEQYATSAIVTLNRGTKKEVGTAAGEAPADCVGCGGCARVCPTGHIEDAQQNGAYSIWDRKFPLAVCGVDKELCRACGACEEACPFSIPRVVPQRDRAAYAMIDVEVCRGCGVCLAACPAGAISAPRAERALPQPGSTGQVLVIACGRANLNCQSSPKMPASAILLELPCTGGVSSKMVLGALARGYQQVLVLGRHEPTCRLEGAEAHPRQVLNRMEQLAAMIGLGRGRVSFVEPEPGPRGAIQTISQALARPFSQRPHLQIPEEGIPDSVDGAVELLSRFAGQGQLVPAVEPWLAGQGFSAARPGEPALLAGAIPYLDLLLAEWLPPLDLSQCIRDGLAVLRALGISAGVAVSRFRTGEEQLASTLSGSEIYGLCPGCSDRARQAGLETKPVAELIAERAGLFQIDGRGHKVALDGADGPLTSALADLGYTIVDVGPGPRVGLKLAITRAEQTALAQRLVGAAEQGARTLLTNGPVELIQYQLLQRRGAWRRTHLEPLLPVSLLAREFQGRGGPR